MSSKNEELDQLREIRNLMEKSSRFLSLSGLAGVAAGLAALLGALVASLYLNRWPFQSDSESYGLSDAPRWNIAPLPFFIGIAASVLLVSVLASYYFTSKKAKRQGMSMWDKTSRRVAFALLLPLFTGGLFCFILIFRGYFSLIAPSMLIFYGLGLVSCAKYTQSEIAYLGVLQLGLGLVGMVYVGYGLELWAIGFGGLHLVYGALFYRKYGA